jgi:hypothetical protein
VPEWDAKFVDIEQETLFELILAANYMDVKSLLDLTCAKVASMIKGKTPEQIRKTASVRRAQMRALDESIGNGVRPKILIPPTLTLTRSAPAPTDPAVFSRAVQHQERLHGRGGGADPRGECAPQIAFCNYNKATHRSVPTPNPR